MKKLLLNIFVATCWTFSAFADYTPTNAVKGSALSMASTPLAGSELVYIIQSGATKMATAAQVQAAATAQDMATSNAYAVTLGSFLSFSNVVNTFSNNMVIYSNQLAVFTNAAAATLTLQTNGLAAKIQGVTNALSGLLLLTNDFYGINNPAGYQTSSQVSSTVSAAVTAGLAGVATANGNAVFTSVSAPVYISATTNINLVLSGAQTITTNLDCSASTVFYATVKAGSGSFTFTPVNLQDGEQVYLLVTVSSGSGSFTLKNGALPGGYTAVGTGALNVTAYSGYSYLLNWVCIGGSKVIFSGAQL